MVLAVIGRREVVGGYRSTLTTSTLCPGEEGGREGLSHRHVGGIAGRHFLAETPNSRQKGRNRYLAERGLSQELRQGLPPGRCDHPAGGQAAGVTWATSTSMWAGT